MAGRMLNELLGNISGITCAHSRGPVNLKKKVYSSLVFFQSYTVPFTFIVLSASTMQSLKEDSQKAVNTTL